MGTGRGFSPTPFPVTPLSRTISQAPGRPARWSSSSRSSLRSETRNFISTPSPSRGTLPTPCAAAESTGCVTSRWRRGTRRGCCRPLGLARKPARGRRDVAGRRRLLQPSSASAPSTRCGRELGNGVGAGPIAAPEGYRGELVPHTSSRHPNSLGKGTPSLSCSADGTVQMRKACKVEPEF